MSATEEFQNLKWEDGLVGTIEKTLEKYPVKKLYKRGLATAITSICIPDLKQWNEIGDVTPNHFLIIIDSSGKFKTPPFKEILNFINIFFPNLKAPARFTIEGFIEHVTGNEEKGIDPHPCGLILRDEISRLAVEKSQKQFSGLLAFLCELWNGYIEGYRTRTYGFEGGCDAFYSFVGASNHAFLRKMDEEFWEIGLGARAEFLTNIEIKFDMYSDEFFWSSSNLVKHKVAFEKIAVMMQQIMAANLKRAYVLPDADQLWREYEYKCRQHANSLLKKDPYGNEIIVTLIAKKAQKVLKLAMNYGASRMTFEDHTLHICLEDMQRAIDDEEEYYKNALEVYSKWKKVRNKKEKQLTLPKSTTKINEYLELAVKLEGLCSTSEVKKMLGDSNATNITKIFLDGRDIGLFEYYCDRFNPKKKLNVEELKRFKGMGPIPDIFKVTEEGYKKAKELGYC